MTGGGVISQPPSLINASRKLSTESVVLGISHPAVAPELHADLTIAVDDPVDATQKRWSKDLHISGIPMVRHDSYLITERPVEGVVWPFDHQAYRRDLRKMTDSELIDESQAHRHVTGLLVLLKPWFLIKLAECRMEWRRRRPEL